MPLLSESYEAVKWGTGENGRDWSKMAGTGWQKWLLAGSGQSFSCTLIQALKGNGPLISRLRSQVVLRHP